MSLLLEELAINVAAGQRPALARALSLAERDASSAERLLSLLVHQLGRAHVIGITGPPGAGKSTLVGVLVQELMATGRRVAVLAVDPSSPVTGGALLGDRFRIGEAAADDRSFIRSTATRGSLGGLSSAAAQMVKLMDAAGFDIVMVETVGTGQSEIDIAHLADSTLVVFPPGLGDEIQAIKAGILELADLVVVTKSDTEAARLACNALQAVLPLWRRAPPIHLVSAMTGQGIGELVAAVIARIQDMQPSRRMNRGKIHAPDAFKKIVEKLQSQLDGTLPEKLTTSLSFEIVSANQASQTHCLQVLCSGSCEESSFQLGAVAGALMVLAKESGFKCTIGDSDLPGGSLRLLFNHWD